MNKFTIGSQWKTRGGWRAVAVGVFEDGGLLAAHDINGRLHETELIAHCNYGMYSGDLRKYDLIEPWAEPIVHDGWVNVIKDNGVVRLGVLHESKEKCNFDGRVYKCNGLLPDIIACVRFKFTEGEGL